MKIFNKIDHYCTVMRTRDLILSCNLYSKDVAELYNFPIHSSFVNDETDEEINLTLEPLSILQTDIIQHSIQLLNDYISVCKVTLCRVQISL